MKTSKTFLLLCFYSIVFQSCNSQSVPEAKKVTQKEMGKEEIINLFKEKDFKGALEGVEGYAKTEMSSNPINSKEYEKSLELLYVTYKKNGLEDKAFNLLKTYRDSKLKNLTGNNLIEGVKAVAKIRQSPNSLSYLPEDDLNAEYYGFSYELMAKQKDNEDMSEEDLKEFVEAIEKNMGLDYFAFMTEVNSVEEMTQEEAKRLTEKYVNSSNPATNKSYRMMILSRLDRTLEQDKEYSEILSNLEDLDNAFSELTDEKMFENLAQAAEKSENSVVPADYYGSGGSIDRIESMNRQELLDLEKELLEDLEDFQTNSIHRPLRRLLTFYKLIACYDRLEEHIKLAECINSTIKESFLYSNTISTFQETEAQDRHFLSGIQTNPFANIIGRYKKHPIYGEVAYNASLTLRSRLLRQTIQMRNAFSEHKDDLITTEVFKLWKDVKKEMLSSYHLVGDENEEKFDSLENVLNLLETDTYFHKAPLLTSEWKEVSKNLSNETAAIEFVQYSYIESESTLGYGYAAVLTKKDESPKFIELFKSNEIETILNSLSGSSELIAQGIYTRGTEPLFDQKNYGDELYKLIWQPLEDNLIGIKEIYFNPTGILNQIAHWALPKDDGYLMDYYSFHQLSTTGLLAEERITSENDIESIALFGGINYNTNNKTEELTSTSISSVYNDRSNYNLQFDYLKGTEREIEEISELTQENGITTQKYLGNNATDRQFLSLGESSKASPSIIHISTHGFFHKNDKMDNVTTLRDELKVMSKSGLAFAGANVLSKQRSVNDGIVLASEVTQMDLNNTKMVVLSACETGLGGLTNGEGVFGFQRSFKEAGVDYILMSLWSIPDAQTKELMSLYYKNLLEGGNNIELAFQKTRQQMRESYPDDPYVWAGFTLVY